MPTLVRLLSVLALIVGAIVAAMAALVTFVEPRQAPITVEVPVPGLAAGGGQSAEPAPAGANP